MIKGQVFEVLLNAAGGDDRGLEFPGLKPLAKFAPSVILQHNFLVISHSEPPLINGVSSLTMVEAVPRLRVSHLQPPSVPMTTADFMIL